MLKFIHPVRDYLGKRVGGTEQEMGVASVLG